MIDLAPLADPEIDLRPAVAPPPAVRAGLVVTARFGVVSATQVREAITAIVAAGLAWRARVRLAPTVSVPPPATPTPPASSSPPLPTGIRAGLRWTLPLRTGGQLAVEGMADLSLLAHDFNAAGIVARERVLRVRLSVFDRSGWLASTPTLALRAVSVDLTLPLDGQSVGSCRLTRKDVGINLSGR